MKLLILIFVFMFQIIACSNSADQQASSDVANGNAEIKKYNQCLAIIANEDWSDQHLTAATDDQLRTLIAENEQLISHADAVLDYSTRPNVKADRDLNEHVKLGKSVSLALIEVLKRRLERRQAGGNHTEKNRRNNVQKTEAEIVADEPPVLEI